MRLPLVVWLLPCLLLSACVAPWQGRAVPDTYASMAVARHEAATGRADVSSASPDPSAHNAHVLRKHPRSATGDILTALPFDGSPLKKQLHQTDKARAVPSMAPGHGLQGPLGRGVLRSQFNGHEPGDSEVPDWAGASTSRTGGVVGNGCGMAAAQDGGPADGDVLRALACLCAPLPFRLRLRPCHRTPRSCLCTQRQGTGMHRPLPTFWRTVRIPMRWTATVRRPCTTRRGMDMSRWPTNCSYTARPRMWSTPMEARRCIWPLGSDTIK